MDIFDFTKKSLGQPLSSDIYGLHILFLHSVRDGHEKQRKLASLAEKLKIPKMESRHETSHIV
ncbi:MAG: hypothetical protein COA70_06685 [Planctomycetota bacterium]|nr:MAG: hypothetical protein COA70_06685 [Planctomycetota bacterium]